MTAFARPSQTASIHLCCLVQQQHKQQYKTCCVCRLATAPDVRMAWMSRFLSLSLSKALPLMVPRLLPLHLMLRQASSGEAVQLPPSLALSSEKLQDDGVYLAENGYEGYIYFAQRVPTELVRALLGLPFCILCCKCCDGKYIATAMAFVQFLTSCWILLSDTCIIFCHSCPRFYEDCTWCTF